MSRQWWAVGGVILLIFGLIGLGWTARDRFLPVEVGTNAPDIEVRDLDGEPVALSDYENEVVLLNIWATWCGPCIEEMPSMQRLYEQLGPEGLKIVAVSVDAPAGGLDRLGRPGGDVAEFVDRFGLTFDVWRDPAGEIQRTYRTTGVPESFLIGRDGVIMKKVIGATEWDSEAQVALVRRLLQSSE